MLKIEPNLFLEFIGQLFCFRQGMKLEAEKRTSVKEKRLKLCVFDQIHFFIKRLWLMDFSLSPLQMILIAAENYMTQAILFLFFDLQDLKSLLDKRV